MNYFQNTYRTPWIGVELFREKVTRSWFNNDKQRTYTVYCLIVRDRHGNVPRKRMIKRLNISWLNKVEPVDISMINPDWFKFDIESVNC